jgi:hypothetical protein
MLKDESSGFVINVMDWQPLFSVGGQHNFVSIIQLIIQRARKMFRVAVSSGG